MNDFVQLNDVFQISPIRESPAVVCDIGTTDADQTDLNCITRPTDTVKEEQWNRAISSLWYYLLGPGYIANPAINENRDGIQERS